MPCVLVGSWTGGLKQQKFIFQRLDRWEVQDQGSGRSGVHWGPSFWFSDSYIVGSSCDMGSQEKASSSVSLLLLFSCSVVSDSLWPHGLQQARLPCPSLPPGVWSHSCPLSRWCYQPSHPLSSPSFPVLNLSQHQGLFQWVSFFASGGQSIGVSASASVLPIFRTDFL